MQRRDRIVLSKICNEIDIALEMMGTGSFESFDKNEKESGLYDRDKHR